MKRKILLLLTMFFTFISSIHAKELYENSEYLKNNYEIVELATKMESVLKEKYNIKRIFEDKYPTYYGGMYISEDSKYLVVQIVKKNIPINNNDEYDFYKSFITFDSRIKVEYVDFSYNELNEINNDISNYMVEKKDKNVEGTYIDVMGNAVNVELNDNSEFKKQELLNNTIKKKNEYYQNKTVEQKKIPVKIVKGNKSSLLETIYSGQKFNTGDAYCSMGFRAKFGGKNGYITAGHCLNKNNQPSHGIIKKLIFSNNGYYDYGFVETNYNFNVSNALKYQSGEITSLGVQNYSPSIIVNMEIAKSGYATGYTRGKVTGLNQTYKASYNNNTYTLKGMVKSNLTAKSGDSGGVVFIPKTDREGGSVAIGVVSGGSEGFLGIGKNMYFTSINDMLGIVRY